MPLADELVDAYQRDGAVVLRGVLAEEEVQRLRVGVDAVIASPSARAVNDGEPGAPGTFFEDFCTWQAVPEFERVIRESALAAAAGRLMRSHEVRMFHDHILVKE